MTPEYEAAHIIVEELRRTNRILCLLGEAMMLSSSVHGDEVNWACAQFATTRGEIENDMEVVREV
jgi:hypothetical protein